MLTEKYKPKTRGELIQDDNLLNILFNYIKGNQKSRPLLIHGKSGSGKTCSVYAIANDLGLEVVEMNASNFRNKEMIKNVIGSALKQKSLFSHGKIILIDEVEAFSGTKDRGGISELNGLIKEVNFPVILTANDSSDEKIKDLKKNCNIIQFELDDLDKIINLLKSIAEKEFGFYDEDVLKKIAFGCSGDIRSAINDLEIIGSVKSDSILDFSRDRKMGMGESIKRVFKSNSANSSLGAFDFVEEDIDDVFLNVEENIPYFYENEDVAKAFDALSKADVFYGRIRKWQYWRFLVYVYSLLTAGISLSKNKKCLNSAYKGKGKRILKYWLANRKYQKRKEICQKIAKVMHQSLNKTTKETFPFLKFFLNNELAKELDLKKEDIDFIRAQ